MHFSITARLFALLATHGSFLVADELPLWEAGIGAFGMLLPDYRGSDQSRGYAYPFPYLRYRGKLLRMDDRRGLAALRLLDTDRMELNQPATPRCRATSGHSPSRSAETVPARGLRPLTA